MMKTWDCRKGYGCQVDLRADYRKFTGCCKNPEAREAA